MSEIDNIVHTIDLDEKLSELLGKYADKIPAMRSMRKHREVVKKIMKLLVDEQVLQPIRKPFKKKK